MRFPFVVVLCLSLLLNLCRSGQLFRFSAILLFRITLRPLAMPPNAQLTTENRANSSAVGGAVSQWLYVSASWCVWVSRALVFEFGFWPV